MKFDQPVVLVTGISSGIGLAVAQMLLETGYCVIGSVRQMVDAELLVRKWSGKFMPLYMDVTDRQSIVDASEEVRVFLDGRNLTALVNNAGVSFNGPLMYQPLDEVRKIFEVNVFGLLAVTQAFLPMLGAGKNENESQRGRVINIGSVSGAITVPFMGAYSASKHAVEALTQALRRELMPWGIEVVSIEPSFIQSNMHQKATDSREKAFYAGTVYSKLWERFGQFMKTNELQAKSPELVTKAVLHALECKRPPTRQPLDGIWYLGKLLPDRWFDKLLLKAFQFNRTD